MKIRKLVGVWCISVLLFGTAGCGNLPWQNSGKLQTDSSQVTSSVEEPSSQRPQSGTAEDAVSSNPSPQGIGVVSINIWEWNYGAAVEWQNHQTVYQVNSENPMTALKVAVAMELK